MISPTSPVDESPHSSHFGGGDEALDELSGYPILPPPFMLPPSVVGTDFSAYWAARGDTRKPCDDTDDEA